ncbi:unnamed protein product [Adineta ricciae]|uniref:DNA-directed RNA polymerase subunit n=1 Tax=Adineta ricciae TaxID=249248 RepID=A0A814VTF7_ADIRI|nr:unnamed protein product [Adineta ricciae]
MSYSSSQISDSVAPYRDIRRVRFGILSPIEILRMSVTDKPIIHPELFETGTRKPKLQGLSDPRQGPVDRHSRCLTCAGSYTECPGHFGHIKLVKPVYHIGFLAKILKILRCICFRCGKLLIDPNDPKLLEIVKNTKTQRHRRLEWVVAACKGKKRCLDSNSILEGIDELDNQFTNHSNGCGQLQPTYRRSGLGIIMKLKGIDNENQTDGTRLTAAHVLEIFKLIPDSICRILGMDPQHSRPEWMILTVIPVPPPCVRPSVLIFGESSAQDDLTYILANIIKANNILHEDEQNGVSSHIIDEHWTYLQYCCATLINNDISNIPKMAHKTGRPLKSLSERLKGKEGRIRCNLMGKRVDFSARSVITADPNLAIDQVGVPKSIAQNLTVPEIVNPFNREWLQEMVSNHTAKYIILENGDRINLGVRTSDISLRCGYIVERPMMDDDLVVFNRQPSLHKVSMMAHRVKLLPWSTFRLNLSVTTPYNADFDGDEMNLHLPQSIEAKAELSELMTVPRLLITPQSNRPVMGIVQDALTGVTKMTRRDVFIDKNDLMNLLMLIPSWNGKIPQPAILKPKSLWTGKQLISLLLPRDVNCARTYSESGSFDWISSSDTDILVENGRLLSGILCKRTLGASAGSLGHIIFMECGYKIAGEFYSTIQVLVNNWLLLEGHSVGINDAVIDEPTTKMILEQVQQNEYKVQQLIEDIRSGQIASNLSSRRLFEKEINQSLNDVKDKVGSLAQQSLSDFNQFKAMVTSGAKGSLINIAQIIACVGQQNVEGKRIPFGFQQRSLPHFFKEDHGPRARGFVAKSYLQGLTPTEFFFHAMGGREGVIDTAIKTAETGYIQRRLVKTMESVMVKYDGTVRNQHEQVIQFIYGEDGLAGEHVEFQKIISLKPSDSVFKDLCKFDLPDNAQDLHEFLNTHVINDLFSNDRSLQILDNEWNQLCQDRQHLRELFLHGINSQLILPCNIDRLIYNAQKLFHISKRTKSDLSPIKIIDDLKNLIQRLTVVKGADSLSQEAQQNAILLMSTLLRSSLCSQQVLKKHHLTSEAFDWLCGEIETRFQQAQVHPGECVGVLAAQSLGEPATQMTLNTFHYAGVSAKNVTLGVPRLREIIGVSKKPRTPSMTIYFSEEVEKDVENCLEVLSNLECCSLKNITVSSSIYYDPDPAITVIEKDQEWTSIYHELATENHSQRSPWLLRIELNRQKMNQKKLTMEQIAGTVTDALNGYYHVIYNDDNSDIPVLHVRLTSLMKDLIDEDNTSGENGIGKIDEDTNLQLLNREILPTLLLKGKALSLTIARVPYMILFWIGFSSISKVNLVETKKFLSNTSKQRYTISDKGCIETIDEYCVVTDGTALQKVLGTKYIDHRRTFTNDLVEIFEVLGIEAARSATQYELKQVMSFDGAYVNARHISLLCDIMTTRGQLMSATRHGINRQGCSPIMRSTFEETVSILLQAAAHAELDPLKGVSENIMLGQLAKIGTGAFDVLVDVRKCNLAMEIPSTNIDTFQLVTNQFLIANTPWTESIATPAYQIADSSTRTASTLNINYRYSPSSPSYTSFQSPNSSTTPSFYRPASPSYTSITSPVYSTGLTSPFYASSSPAYHPTTPVYRSSQSNPPSSPLYSPMSPRISYSSATSPMYSPTSPQMYSQTSSVYRPNVASPLYPQSPNYSPNFSTDGADDFI